MPVRAAPELQVIRSYGESDSVEAAHRVTEDRIDRRLQGVRQKIDKGESHVAI